MARRESPFTGREVLIAEAARTPFGRSHPDKGWFRDTNPNDLLGAVYRELLDRAEIAPGVVEDLVVGCTAPFGEPWTARMWEQYDFVPQGESAELIAERWDISREEMDEFAARSHRIAAAIEAGRFDAEMIGWELDGERPVGATGARLMATIVAEVERCDVELGLVTMCCGGGLGTGTLVQRVS